MSIDDLAKHLGSEDSALKAFRFFLEKAREEVIDETSLQAEIDDYLVANSQFGVGA